MSFWRAIADAATGLTAAVTARTQTPSGNAMNVIIGPADVVNSITPVMIDWEHHQLHEGETLQAQDVQAALGTSTVKYAFTTGNFTGGVYNTPHLLIGADVYNGTVLIQIYETATHTNGSALNIYNRNRNVSLSQKASVVGGVTSTNGTLIESRYVGAGAKSADSNRAVAEWVLKNNTEYRIDVIGQVNGTAAIVSFQWYEDQGV